MGGSQGASAINELVMAALPLIAARAPALQWIHLTGPHDLERVSRAYVSLRLTSQVHAFSSAMNLLMGAATVAVSRAGASSLAEIAALRLPSLLVPYPTAADNHQFHNARAFVESGAARLLDQKTATPESFTRNLLELLENAGTRDRMKEALAQWHSPRAAEEIALAILKAIAASLPQSDARGAGSSSWTEHAFAIA
jgi:UDP-N-acetylglucosamine--N-acetylmuramyl-(pentapeptide) pyrophosphoryl-undecaprenol N-acetylglucosamine transferase